MKDVSGIISYKDKEYKIVFNLNVMQALQEEYGTIYEWTKLTDGIDSEVDIKALVFGLTQMINEGIEINNEDHNLNDPILSTKQVGRMLTDYGLQQALTTMQKTVIESTKSEEKNV